MRKIQPISFTKEGLENIKKDYEALLAERPQAVKNLTEARNMGDLSENGLYKGTRARLTSIDATLRRLKNTIKLAVVEKVRTNGTIGIGSAVTVSDGKKSRIFYIVGTYESDPATNKISAYSPIGRSLLSKKVGDKTDVQTPSGIISYNILEIK